VSAQDLQQWQHPRRLPVAQSRSSDLLLARFSVSAQVATRHRILVRGSERVAETEQTPTNTNLWWADRLTSFTQRLPLQPLVG
jgi:hypothetical protein